MEELRLRKAIPETRSAPLKSDLALLDAIQKAENDGALEYLLKVHGSVPKVYYRESGDGKRLLTLQGFQAYRGKLSKEAFAYFTSEGVPLAKLRGITGPAGENLIGDLGQLSYRGMEIYREALKGRKNWYAPGEQRPLTPEESRAEKLLKSGYTELIDPEYTWLRGVTRCSDKTFATYFGVIFMERKGRTQRRFLKISGEGSSGILYSYVYKYRRGEISESGETSTAFFGTGATAKKSLCGPNGRPWTGE